MKKILLIASFLVLGACAKDDSKNDDGKVINDQPGGNAKPIAANCGGAAASSALGQWKVTIPQKGLTLKMVFDIQPNNIRLTNYCRFDNGRSLSAIAQSTANVSNSTITINNSDSDTQKIDEPGFKANCSSNISAATVRYSLNGSCLVIEPNSSDSLTLERN